MKMAEMDSFTSRGFTYPYSTGRVLEVGSRLKFTVKSPQRLHDDWRGTERICRYYGSCRACGIMTYAFDDGENDPRGALGDHASAVFRLSDHVATDDAPKVRAVGDVVLPACFGCMNDYDRYMQLADMATRRARKLGADI